MAGLLPVEVPDRPSQQRPLSRAPSAIDFSRPMPSGFQTSRRPPSRPPSRSFAPGPAFGQATTRARTPSRLSGPHRRGSVAGWDTITPWARSTHASQPARPASARAYWDHYGGPFSLGYEEARLNDTGPRFYLPPLSSQPFPDYHIEDNTFLENPSQIDNPGHGPPYHDGESPRDAAIRHARRFRSLAGSSTMRASSTDHFDSDWDITSATQFEGSFTASPPKIGPSVEEGEISTPPCNPFKHPKPPKDTNEVARKTPVTQFPAAELDNGPSSSRPSSRRGLRSETFGKQVQAPTPPEPQDLGSNTPPVPRSKAAEKKRPASRQARSPSTAKKQRNANQKAQMQKRQNIEHQDDVNQVQLGSYALKATLSALPETTDSEAVATNPKFAATACTRCRQRKVRCDRLFPACGTCTKAGVLLCLYPTAPQQTDPEHPEDHTNQSLDHSLVDNKCDQREAPIQVVTEDHVMRKRGIPDRVTVHTESQETERQGLEEVAVPKTNLSDVGTQTDKPVGQRLRMDLPQWTALVISGIELQKRQYEKLIQNVKGFSVVSLDRKEKLLGAARVGVEFREDLRGLYREAAKDDGR